MIDGVCIFFLRLDKESIINPILRDISSLDKTHLPIVMAKKVMRWSRIVQIFSLYSTEIFDLYIRDNHTSSLFHTFCHVN